MYRFSSLLLLLFLSFSCSRMTDEDLWKRVEQSRTTGNSDSTLVVCSRILQEYPAGVFAPAALYMIGETHLNARNDPGSAIRYFQLFVQRYPDLKQTPVAYFLIGFIFNNNLHILDSARIVYAEFLSIYPNHSLAASAKMELDNLGREPDDIIRFAEPKISAQQGKKSKSAR